MATNAIMKNIARLLFLLLFLYEALNYFHILPFTPVFAWIGLFGTLGFIWLALELFDIFSERAGVPMLRGLTWLAAFGAVAWDSLGDIHHLYDGFSWYDQLAHFSGSAVIVFVLLNMIESIAIYEEERMPVLVRALLAYGFSMMFGALYEVNEYLEDLFLGSHQLGDGPDTANDLLMDFLGATLVFVLFLAMKNLARTPKMVDTKLTSWYS